MHHSFFITLISVLLNETWDALSLTVIILVDFMGAAELPKLTTRCLITLVFSSERAVGNGVAPEITGMWLMSTLIFFFSRILATAASRGSFKLVTGVLLTEFYRDAVRTLSAL